MSDIEWLKSLSNEAVLFFGLLVVGKALKKSPVVDWIIPHVVGIFGVVVYQMMVGVSARNAMVGLSIAGMTVFGHQIVKQWKDARQSGDTKRFLNPNPQPQDPPASEPMSRHRGSFESRP